MMHGLIFNSFAFTVFLCIAQKKFYVMPPNVHIRWYQNWARGIYGYDQLIS